MTNVTGMAKYRCQDQLRDVVREVCSLSSPVPTIALPTYYCFALEVNAVTRHWRGQQLLADASRIMAKYVKFNLPQAKLEEILENAFLLRLADLNPELLAREEDECPRPLWPDGATRRKAPTK